MIGQWPYVWVLLDKSKLPQHVVVRHKCQVGGLEWFSGQDILRLMYNDFSV